MSTLGRALVLTFQLRDIYILACHTCHHASFVFCFCLSACVWRHELMLLQAQDQEVVATVKMQTALHSTEDHQSLWSMVGLSEENSDWCSILIGSRNNYTQVVWLKYSGDETKWWRPMCSSWWEMSSRKRINCVCIKSYTRQLFVALNVTQELFAYK